jgi:hypothetical protein
MQKDDVAGKNFRFFPLDWIGTVYHITGLNKDQVEHMESRKEEYMEERGYVQDGSAGCDAGYGRTSRLMVGEVRDGK